MSAGWVGPQGRGKEIWWGVTGVEKSKSAVRTLCVRPHAHK